MAGAGADAAGAQAPSAAAALAMGAAPAAGNLLAVRDRAAAALGQLRRLAAALAEHQGAAAARGGGAETMAVPAEVLDMLSVVGTEVRSLADAARPALRHFTAHPVLVGHAADATNLPWLLSTNALPGSAAAAAPSGPDANPSATYEATSAHVDAINAAVDALVARGGPLDPAGECRIRAGLGGGGVAARRGAGGARLRRRPEARRAAEATGLVAPGVEAAADAFLYSPKLLERAAARDAPGVALRAAQLATAALALLMAKRLDEIQGKTNDARRVKARSAQLRQLATWLGPTFIKAGQFLANRPDIVRADYMDELMKLQDDVPAFDHATAMAILRADLDLNKLEDVFVEVPTRPIAAASIGVVYRATMREPGCHTTASTCAPPTHGGSPGGVDVAVKIQRPNLRQSILRDLWLFRYAATKYLDGISRSRLGCEASVVVDEFGRSLLRELDFNAEARALKAFRRNFDDDGEVVIPDLPFPDCNTPRVLVMTWVDGVRLTDVAAVQAAGVDVQRFISTGVRAGMKQLLSLGLFHGDPHPGNVFAMRNNSIGYIDFGNVSELSKADQSALLDALIACMNEDYDKLTRALQELGFLSDDEEVRKRVTDALRRVWIEVAGQGRFDAGALAEDFSFRKITDQFSNLMYDYPLRVPERFAIIIRTLLTQEGICLQLDPKFKFLNVAYPHVARMLLTDRLYTRRLADVLIASPATAEARNLSAGTSALAPGELDWERLFQLLSFAKTGAGGGVTSLLPTLLKGAWAVLSDPWLLWKLAKAAMASLLFATSRAMRAVFRRIPGRRRGNDTPTSSPAFA